MAGVAEEHARHVAPLGLLTARAKCSKVAALDSITDNKAGSCVAPWQVQQMSRAHSWRLPPVMHRMSEAGTKASDPSAEVLGEPVYSTLTGTPAQLARASAVDGKRL